MSALSLHGLIRRFRSGANSPSENTDAELLARFVARRDEDAFELLVWRHAAMVFNLCRRMLRREQDAEDAFQATFLALAREAHRIRARDSLGGWLYRVAFRIGLKSRAMTRRAARGPVPECAGPDSTVEVDVAELRAVLDEEVVRLPAKYRLPFVLCCLGGRSNTEAAREIGCPRGTVDSRLSWAKQRLRMRLLKRGVTSAAAALALEPLGASDAAATVAAEIVRETVRSSLAFIGGAAAGVLPSPAALARGVIHAMFIDRLKRTMFAVVAVALLATGAGWITFHAQAQNKPTEGKEPVKVDPPKTDPPATVAKPPDPKKAVTPGMSERNQVLRKSLDRVVDIERPIDASLRDVLEFLSDRFDLTIVVDDIAFRRLEPPLENVEETRVKLQKLPGVKVSTVLELILAQITEKQIGIVVVPIVKGGQIRIAPAVPVVRNGEYLPAAFVEPVKISAEDQPFTDVVRDLVDQTGANIVVDTRAKEQARKSVSAQLQGAPLLTAARVLADMVELKVVTMDNVLYITTPENALKWKRDHSLTTIDPPKPTVSEKKEEKKE